MRIVILGGGFGGLNAALLLGKALQSTPHEIVLLSDAPCFLFRPSLIWVPFNKRQIKEISFPLNEILQKVRVQFMQKRVVSILPKEKQISHYSDVSITKVEPGCLQLSNGVSLPYSFSLILPPYKGAEFIFASPDLDHENGLLVTNKGLQSTQWENIYVVGDANAMKEYKSGRAAEVQGKIAARNILNRIQGHSRQQEYHPDMLYVMELGTDGGMFVIRYPGSREGTPYFEWAVDGYLPHLMKLAFEKYYSWKLS